MTASKSISDFSSSRTPRWASHLAVSKCWKFEVRALPPEECRREIFVRMRWNRKEGLAASLAQLKPAGGTAKAARQAVEDWPLGETKARILSDARPVDDKGNRAAAKEAPYVG